jgi:hypothetical protein
MIDNWDIIVPLSVDSFYIKGERLSCIGYLKMDDNPATAV